MAPSRRLQKGRVDDLVLLDQVDEEAVLSNLRNRFDEKAIYTYIGSVLLSVNPFKSISGLYGKDVIAEYIGKLGYDMPPHVYAVAENAYRAMTRERSNQCILVSGESGAGKTEAAKRLLEYIAAVSAPGSSTGGDSAKTSQVKDALLNSNNVLEAFGNAKTLRNDNSSRFGKYMEILFDPSGAPVAGKLSNYLLENPRVVSQGEGEQNYHIFYLLLEGMSEDGKRQLLLPPVVDATHFAYLSNRCRDEDASKSLGLTFEELDRNMDTIGFSATDKDQLLKVCTAVLWLGNIEFDSVNDADERSGRVGSSVSKSSGSQAALGNAASLLGIGRSALEKALCNRLIVTGGESMNKVLSKEEAGKTRDALAKALYGRSFQRLVEWINAAICPATDRQVHGYVDPEDRDNSIGVLDIYGFEIFGQNSFEQLCINYCNEKLQQLFIDLTLRAEQAEYLSEGIEWENVEYFNNKQVCELIEQKKRGFPGLLALLDEECSLLGRVSDQTLVQKLDKTLRAHPHYGEVKTSPDHFVVKHYAGEVKYTADGFLDKNKDTLFRDLVELMGASKHEKVKSLFPEHMEKRDQSKPPTAGMQFKAQMLELVATLNLCQPSYIRCIKSNDGKLGGVFDTERCREQVRYLGILENVKVRRAGYAHRVLVEDFVQRYKMLSPKTWPCPPDDHLQAVEAIFQSINCDSEAFKFGHTKVFIRKAMTLFSLEGARDRKMHDIASIIQRAFRQFKAKRELQKMRERAISLFNNSKCRGKSFRFYFCGDYVHAMQSPVVKASLAPADKVLFADVITKLTRDGKKMDRLLVITTKELLFFKPTVIKGAYTAKGLARRARFPLASITNATLSSFADGYMALEFEGGSKAGAMLYTERKAEIMTLLKDHLPGLDIEFKNEFNLVTSKPGGLFGNSKGLDAWKVIFEENKGEKPNGMPSFVYTKQSHGSVVKVSVPPNLASAALISVAHTA